MAAFLFSTGYLFVPQRHNHDTALNVAYEKDIKRAVKNAGLPVIKSPCPADKNTERERIKQLLYSLEKDYDRLRIKTIGAMQRAHISGW